VYNPPVSSVTPKTYFIKTYGCQANIADSIKLAGVLESLGFEKAKDMQDSDVLVVNTCSVRQKSEDKIYGLAQKLKKKKPFIILAGCMVGSVTGDRTRYAFTELKERTPWVDVYIAPSQLLQIPNILLEHNLIDPWTLKKLDLTAVHMSAVTTNQAFVNISYGCDNFCTYCVVPFARGAEISRPKQEILDEINQRMRQGVHKFVLCGQNVNSWALSKDEKFKIRAGSDQNLPFAGLLREIHAMAGVEKIEFLSSNPFDFTQDLISVLKLPKISNYLHIAVQSGNNDILTKMNRRHTIEDFINLIVRIKQVRPNIVLGTDIIVGFPGETDSQFMDTVTLFKKITFKVAFISIYSPRKGTPAERFFEDNISLKEKKRRHALLTKVWKETGSL